MDVHKRSIKEFLSLPRIGEGIREPWRIIIPDYQREFVWKEKSCNEFLEDITKALRSDKVSDYFIGVLVTSDGISGKNEIEIIDGQQRLTFCQILLYALKYRFARIAHQLQETWDEVGDIQNLTRLNGQPLTTLHYLSENENRFFDVIHDMTSDLNQNWEDIEASGKAGASYKKIINAWKIASDFVEDHSRDELKEFYRFFINDVHVVQLHTSTDVALQTFESLNSKGQGLSSVDLIKNYLFMQVEDSKKKSVFSKLNTTWKKIPPTLGSEKLIPDFIRAYILRESEIVKGKNTCPPSDGIYSWVKEEYNDEEANEKKTKFSTIAKKDSLELVESMMTAASEYRHIVDNKFVSDQGEAEYLKMVAAISSRGKQHRPLLFCSTKINKNTYEAITKRIETLYLILGVGGVPGNQLESEYINWAAELKNKSNRDAVGVINKMDSFIKSKRETFELGFQRLNYLSDYKIMRYLLLRINNHIEQTVSGGRASMSTFLDEISEEKHTLDHILPQSVLDQLSQKDRLNKDYKSFKGLFSQEEESISNMVHGIGNLTIVTQSENSSLKDKPFGERLPIYQTCKFALTKYAFGAEPSVQAQKERLKGIELYKTSRWSYQGLKDRRENLLKMVNKIFFSFE